MLSVRDLKISFTRYDGLLRRTDLRALDGVDVEVERGELLAVVGQSGAGKSLLAHAILGVLPRNATATGRMVFDGLPLDEKRQSELRGRRIALVPQAVTWLDPTARAARQIGWSASAAGLRPTNGAVTRELARYDLSPAAGLLFPHQLSGGMARRVLTAIATISRAEVLIADEPTTGLDPAVRDLSLKLLRRLADEGRCVVVITHDIAAILPFADRFAILRDGRTVECCSSDAFRCGRTAHPYSRALRSALPEFGFALEAPDTPPVPAETAGCGYRYECARATTVCAADRPAWTQTPDGRVRCHHV
jgi:peptide/nickel transport system ATP-binding protein